MQRYDKKTMTVYSQEYDELLKKEIGVWSQYKSSEKTQASYEDVRSIMQYQTYRKGTIELELDYIRNHEKNISILELGSADGWLTNEMLKLKNVKDITSIDISLNSALIKKYSDRSIAVKGDLNKIEKINFNKKFDCITTHGTLHHLVDPKKTLEYCIDNLMKVGSIMIIDDTWILNSLQLKTSAFFYLIINRLGHAIWEFDLLEALKIMFYKIPYVLINKNFADSITHSHNTSPFESISSADDYKEFYRRKDLEILYFRNFAALPGLQNTWSKSPKIIKSMIQKMDNFLIDKKIYTGDLHICILQKKLSRVSS